MSESSSPSTTHHPLHLEHLYDAYIYPIGNTSGLWGPINLLPELLPRVISFLDPDEDLATFLAVQRCSTYAWECATPKVYRSVTIRDWSKFMQLPQGLDTHEPLDPEALMEPRTCTDPAHIRSINRRREAFRSIKSMTIHVFPTTATYRSFKHLTYDGMKKIACGLNDCNDQCDKMFLGINHLRISERAMEPICHGGVFADRWIGIEDGEKYTLDELCPTLLGQDAQIPRGCIMLPQKREHTMEYAIEKVIEGDTEYTDQLEDGEHFVKPSETVNSSVIGDVLSCFKLTASVSIHNMTDLWIRRLCGHQAYNFQLFFSPAAPKIPPCVAGALSHYRALAYAGAIECKPDTDHNRCDKCGTLHFQTTWTINGEANCIKNPSDRGEYLQNLVKGACNETLFGGRFGELQTFMDGIETAPQGETLGSVAPGVRGKIRRMKFVNPGEEEPCSFCRRL